jgi:hypothetical protein
MRKEEGAPGGLGQGDCWNLPCPLRSARAWLARWPAAPASGEVELHLRLHGRVRPLRNANRRSAGRQHLGAAGGAVAVQGGRRLGSAKGGGNQEGQGQNEAGQDAGVCLLRLHNWCCTSMAPFSLEKHRASAVGGFYSRGAAPKWLSNFHEGEAVARL